MKSKSSDFAKIEPWNSVLQKAEAETIALNVMKILKRTGDTWRTLSNEEYELERRKDGNWSFSELKYLEQIRPYTISADKAKTFSPDWKD